MTALAVVALTGAPLGDPAYGCWQLPPVWTAAPGVLAAAVEECGDAGLLGKWGHNHIKVLDDGRVQSVHNRSLFLPVSLQRQCSAAGMNVQPDLVRIKKRVIIAA